MSNEKKFIFDSLQDAESVGIFLEAITDGMRNGRILLSSANEQIEMQPRGLLTFSLRAKRKGSSNKISFKVEWKDRQEDAEIKTLVVGS